MSKRSLTHSPHGRQVSQREIGELAGVSQATVSLVLAGRKVNSEETRVRVLEAARHLKYRPNLLVHGMQTGKSKAIGVMAPPYDYYWSRVLYGIHDTLAQNDYVPITVWPSHSGGHYGYETDELAQIHRLLDRRVDGVILWPPFAALFSEHVNEFSSRDLPIVLIDHMLPPSFQADSVGSNERMGAHLVAQHLFTLGHRRIVHIAGPSVTAWGKNRRCCFEAEIAKLPGVFVASHEVPPGGPELGLELVRKVLSATDRPTAIYAASDSLAKIVYRVAAERGFQIPRDLSVVGFADHEFAAELTPPLTTIRQPAYEIGCKAAEIVTRAAVALERIPTHVELPVELIIRESTGPGSPIVRIGKATRK
jgi:DNA-binding LacI/PurR family transcriptional regulator